MKKIMIVIELDFHDELDDRLESFLPNEDFNMTGEEMESQKPFLVELIKNRFHPELEMIVRDSVLNLKSLKAEIIK